MTNITKPSVGIMLRQKKTRKINDTDICCYISEEFPNDWMFEISIMHADQALTHHKAKAKHKVCQKIDMRLITKILTATLDSTNKSWWLLNPGVSAMSVSSAWCTPFTGIFIPVEVNATYSATICSRAWHDKEVALFFTFKYISRFSLHPSALGNFHKP